MLTIKALMAGAVLAGGPPTTDVNDLAWMAGYWLDCSNGREASEAWSDPRAGMVAGLGVTVRNGRVGFEASHIRADEEGRLTYFAQPDGAAPTPFVLIESGPGRAKFENLDPHDFPRHISYEREGDGLTARIDGEIGGQARSVEWRFDRADLNTRCPG